MNLNELLEKARTDILEYEKAELIKNTPKVIGTYVDSKNLDSANLVIAQLQQEISILKKENEELRDKIQRAIDGMVSPMAHTKTQIVKILSN